MRITKKDGYSAIVDAGGVSREINLRLLEDARIGDYVLVHAGFAIETIDEHEAEETLKLMEQIGLMQNDDEVH